MHNFFLNDIISIRQKLGINMRIIVSISTMFWSNCARSYTTYHNRKIFSQKHEKNLPRRKMNAFILLICPSVRSECLIYFSIYLRQMFLVRNSFSFYEAIFERRVCLVGNNLRLPHMRPNFLKEIIARAHM